MPIQRRLLIVIADGEHARFVRPGSNNALHTERTFDATTAHKRSADLGSDRPGASFHSDSTAHHAVAPRHDLHELEKEKFADSVGTEINHAVAEVGVFFPIEAFERDEPTMRDQERLAARSEELGYAALWTRDVPLRDPQFGDLGQVYDPWVWLGWIAAHTRSIALATGSIVLPLRHPLHTAKAAASVDRLSGGRLMLGVASGDRPVEFPAFGVNAERRGVLFRENLALIRKVLTEEYPRTSSSYGVLEGAADLVPKPVGGLPILVTGSSRQTMEWIAANADGWITYPRPLDQQLELVARWRALTAVVAPGVFKPIAQSLYIDLAEDPDHLSQAIHLGFRSGRNVVFAFLDALRRGGMNHIILNLKYGARHASDVLEEIGREVLPRLESSQPRTEIAE